MSMRAVIYEEMFVLNYTKRELKQAIKKVLCCYNGLNTRDNCGVEFGCLETL